MKKKIKTILIVLGVFFLYVSNLHFIDAFFGVIIGDDNWAQKHVGIGVTGFVIHLWIWFYFCNRLEDLIKRDKLRQEEQNED